MSELRATSIYGVTAKQGLVQLSHQDWVVQVTPQEARSWALNILECAEAAEQEAFLVQWAGDLLGAGHGNAEAAANILLLYRDYREKAR